DDGVEGDRLAHGEVGADPGAEGGHGARRLVAHHLAGEPASVLPGVAVQVGPADPGRGDPDEDLPMAGLRRRPLLHLQGADLLDHKCTHVSPMSRVSAGRPGGREGQWDSRVTSDPLWPTRKSRSAPRSAPVTVLTYRCSQPRVGRA